MPACINNYAILPPVWRYTFGAINVAVAAVAFIGNFLIGILMLKVPSLRSRANIIIGSLVATDLVVGLLLAPMHSLELFSEIARQNCSLNDVRRFLDVFLLAFSAASVALISYDRYVHISKIQEHAHHMRRKKVAFVIFPCLVLSALIDQRFYGVVTLVYLSSILVIMLVSCQHLIKIAKEREQQVVQGKKENPVKGSKQDIQKKKEDNWQRRIKERQTKRHIQAAKMASMIISCFVACLSPLTVYTGFVAVEAFLSAGIPEFNGAVKGLSYTVAMILAMARSAINPVIYYLEHPKFREQLQKIFQ